MQLDHVEELSTDKLSYGSNQTQRVVERETPDTLFFETANGKDVHVGTEVTLVNADASSTSADVTVTRDLVHGGRVHDTTETTRTVSLDASTERVETFRDAPEPLINGRYRVSVSVDGTLALSQTAVELRPRSVQMQRRTDGTVVIEDDEGRARQIYPVDSPVTKFPGGFVDSQGNSISDLVGAGLSVSEGTLQTRTHAESVTVSGDGTTTVSIPHSLGEIPSQAFVEATSSAAAGTWHVSDKTSSEVTIIYASAPASGTDNLSYDIRLCY